MAVSLTVAQIAVQLRVIAAEADTLPAGQSAVLGRHLAAATAMVERYAPLAPVAIENEAAARLVGYLYDRAPHEGRGGNPMILSGAAHVLSRFRVRTVTAPAERPSTSAEITG